MNETPYKSGSQKTLRLPKAVFLDLDDTIYSYAGCQTSGLKSAHTFLRKEIPRFKTWPGFLRAYHRARRSVKTEVGTSAAQHSRLLYFKEMIETEKGWTDIRLLKSVDESYWKGYLAALRLDPGVAAFLRLLKKLRIRTAWVTNFTTDWQCRKLLTLKVAAAVDFLFTSESAGGEKSSGKPFRLALRKLKVRPNQVWMIGDDLVEDIEIAKKLGLKTLWYNRASRPLPRFARPDFVCRSWQDVINLVRYAEAV